MRLGMLASKQLNGSLRAMSDFQEKRVKMLIDRDRELDELEAEINERVLMIITVRSPRADDLRRVDRDHRSVLMRDFNHLLVR